MASPVRQYAEVGRGQSWGGPRDGRSPAGSGAEPWWGPAEAEKQDINFALRITLIDAYLPFLPRDATQSVVMPQYVVCMSVHDI